MSVNVIEGTLTDPGGRFAIVAGRFNEFVVDRLVDGAIGGLRRHGIAEDRIDVIWVPGAFEIPLACQKAAASGNYSAVLALGAVIRGATSHFDFVAGGAASGVQNASLSTGVPILFGVITTDTIEQAIERSGTKAGNIGFNSALSALEMVNVLGAI